MSQKTVSAKDGGRRALCGERLLTVGDVADITGLCYAVASDIIDETGRGIVLHSHKYVFESALYEFLQEKASA